MATQDEVDGACVAISARGERPTVDRVRTELGGGSPNSLTPMVRTWKDAQRQQSSPAARQTADASEPTPLPASIQHAVVAITSAVGALAPAFAEAIAGVAESERRRTRMEIEAMEAGAKAQVEDAKASADDERATTDLVRQEVSEKEAEITALTARIHGLEGEGESLVTELAKAGEAQAAAAATARKAIEDSQAEAGPAAGHHLRSRGQACRCPDGCRGGECGRGRGQVPRGGCPSRSSAPPRAARGGDGEGRDRPEG